MADRTTAQQLLDAANAMDADMTHFLKGLVEKLGGTLDGLEHRMKPQEALQSKLATLGKQYKKKLAKSGGGSFNLDIGSSSDPVHEANCNAQTIEEKDLLATDALRYTALFPAEQYSSAVASIRAAFEAKGYLPHDQKNFWPLNASGHVNTFRGIIDTLIVPTNALPCGRLLVEVQFMTPESLANKDQIGHDLYMVFRGAPTLEQRVKAQAMMLKRAEGVSTPSGVDELPKNIGKKRRTMTKARLASIPSRNEELPPSIIELLASQEMSAEELDRLVPDYDDDDIKSGRQQNLDLFLMLISTRSPMDAIRVLLAPCMPA